MVQHPSVVGFTPDLDTAMSGNTNCTVYIGKLAIEFFNFFTLAAAQGRIKCDLWRYFVEGEEAED